MWGNRWKGETVRCVIMPLWCHHQVRLLARQAGHAPDALPLLLHCHPPDSSSPVSHSGEAQYGGRYVIYRRSLLFPTTCPGGQVPTLPPGSGVVGSSDARATGLDLREFVVRSAFYFSHGVAGSSQRTYKSGEKRFLCFCDSCHVTPLSVSEDVLCKFVSHLAYLQFVRIPRRQLVGYSSLLGARESSTPSK